MKNKILLIFLLGVTLMLFSSQIFAGGYTAENVRFLSSTFCENEKVYMFVDITGGEYLYENRTWYVSFVEKNFETTGRCFSTPIINLGEERPYFEVPMEYFILGEQYYLKSISCVDEYDGNNSSQDIYIANLEEAQKRIFTVVEDNLKLTSIEFQNRMTEFDLCEKIKLNWDLGTDKVYEANALICSNDNEELSRYIKVSNIYSSPYIDLEQAQQEPKFVSGNYSIISIDFRYTTEQGTDKLKTYVFDKETFDAIDEYHKDKYNQHYFEKNMDFTIVDKVGTIPFTDISLDNWYFNAVYNCYKNNIINGTSSTAFSPNNKVTRGMMVTMLYSMAGAPVVSGTNKFTDVSSSKYYYNAITWASENNIVKGYAGTTKFGPDDYITREQLAVMLTSFAMYNKKYTASNYGLNKFKDYTNVSGWATSAVKWAVKNRIINGSNGNINPKSTTTRAEAATMIYSYCLNIK